jgi:hypothetical protein
MGAASSFGSVDSGLTATLFFGLADADFLGLAEAVFLLLTVFFVLGLVIGEGLGFYF